MGELCVGDRVSPHSWLVSANDTEIGFDFLVYSFSLSIRLWVIGGREGKIVLENAPKFLGKFGGKLGSMIGDDFRVQSKAAEDFVKKE